MQFTGKTTRRVIAVLIGFWLAAGVYPASLHGYVLPAPYIIEQMSAGMGLPQQFQVTQVLHIARENSERPNDRQSAADPVFEQVLRYRLPGMFRSDIESPDIRHTHISVTGEAITVIDDAVMAEPEYWLYGYKELFLYRDGQPLVDRLDDMGVNIYQTSIGRLDGTLCYVIGARYPDMDAPQLWVERDGFMPVRLVLTGAANNGEEPESEIRFSDWRRMSGMRYPGEISLIEKGDEIRKIVVESVDANPVFESGIFDIQALRSSLKDDAAQENEPDLSDEIRREIEAFKRIYE